MKHWGKIGLVVAWALVAPVAAFAEPPKDVGGNAPLEVEVNKGEMLRLPRAASSVIVADPSIADIQVISPRLVFIHGKKIGETSIVAIDSSDATILNATVDVTHNLSKLNRTLKQMMPDSDVEFQTVDNGLIVNGYVGSPGDSASVSSLAGSFLPENQRVINMLSTGGSDQVMIRVKVAEVSRNALKRFGINLQEAFTSGNFAFQLLQGRAVATGTSGLVTRNASDNSIFLSHDGNNIDSSAVIDALEEDRLVTVLAEPSLTTVSGKTANFLAGGEFPIPIVAEDGSVNITYKPFGVSLNFTPVVMGKDRISLNVAPEVSDISQSNSVTVSNNTTYIVPTLTTEKAQTTVELGSGQTFAIAGLLKNNRSQVVNKFPGLGDLPVLGALFRSQEFRNNQTELVILVTPFIVRPVDDRMATPLDGIQSVSDVEMMLTGKLYGDDSIKPGDPKPIMHENAPVMPDEVRLNGDAGYVLE